MAPDLHWIVLYGDRLMLPTRRKMRFVIVVVLVSILLAAVRSMAGAGDSDPSFGIRLQPFPEDFSPRQMTVQRNGKFIVAGNFIKRSGIGSFVLARFHQDGSLDRTFGTDGFVIEDFSAASGGRDSAEAVAVDSHGRIVAVGYANGDITGAGSSNGSAGVAVRYRPNGQRDQTFGDHGVFLLQTGKPNGDCGFHALHFRSDGRLLVAGSLDYSMLALALKTNGTLDTTFGDHGVVTIHKRPSSDATAVDIDSLGRVLLGGTTIFPSYGGRYSGDFLIVRLQSNGKLDASFGNQGITVLDLSRLSDSMDSIAALPGNSIVADGSIYQGDEAGLVKLHQNGHLNPAFGNHGLVITGNEELFVPSRLLVESDGRLILCGTGSGPIYRVIVFRYLPNGRPDTSFHSTGVRPVGFGRENSFEGVCGMTSDNKLIVGGIVQRGTRSTTMAFERLFLQ